jgi:hypothetical protein
LKGAGLRIIAISLLLSFVLNSSSAYAAGVVENEIDSLTDEIVRTEIDFLKLNTNLRLHQLPNAWTARRWWLFNAAGVALTATGAYINGFGRFSYLHSDRLKRAPKYLFANGGWLRVTANAVMVGGGLFETAMLAYKDWKDKRAGVNLPVMFKYADETQNKLDDLLTKRAALVATLPAGPDREVMEAEGAVLQDVRDLEVDEFVRYFSETKGSRAFFYTSYLIAAASNFLAGAGGIAANVGALKVNATTGWKTRLGGAGGIADIISGSLNQSVPLAIRVASHIASSRAKEKLCKELHCGNAQIALDQLIADEEKLDRLVTSATASKADARNRLYERQIAVFDQHAQLSQRDKHSRKQRLISQSIFFTGIGTPKIVNGIGTSVGAFKYTNNSMSRFKAIGYPAVAYGVGYSVAIAELIRYQLVGEVNAVRARETGTSAGQVLKRQIDELEQMSTDAAIK